MDMQEGYQLTVKDLVPSYLLWPFPIQRCNLLYASIFALKRYIYEFEKKISEKSSA